MSLVRLAIRVRAETAEVALARLLPVLGAGAEEREREGAVEYALYGRPEELPDEARLRALAGDALLSVAAEPVGDGWETAWHAHLGRVAVGALAVRPPWVAGEPGDLVLEPGRAFGAGTHPSTQLCLELLQGLEPAGALCDWGTGSGVLAVAAARLGWAPVDAVDLTGAELVRANAAANGVRVRVTEADLAAVRAPWAPTVAANLPLDVHRAVAAVQPRPQRLLASGVLAGQLAALAAAWAPLAVVERSEREGWGAMVLAAS